MIESASQNDDGTSKDTSSIVGGLAAKEDNCSPAPALASPVAKVQEDDQSDCGHIDLSWINPLDILIIFLGSVVALVVICLMVPYVSLD